MPSDATTATFAGVWERAAAARADQPFLVFEGPDGGVASWTYGELDSVVGRVAARFARCGVEPGSAVHLALTNSPTFVAAWLAAVRLGAWVVPSDPMATAPELVEHLSRTRPSVGLCANSRVDVYGRAAAEAGLATTLVFDEADTSFADLPTTGVERWPVPAPTDRAAVMFTSGTTGRPKGVEVTQANYAFAGATMAAAAGLGPDDRQLVVLPLFHANAQYYSFASAIHVGASVALMHTFSASRFLEQAGRHAATHASLFAGPMRMILARGGPLDDPSQLRLRHCWFAQNLADDQYETLAEWFGCRPRQLYGMTETIPAVLTDEATDPRPDTMGYETPGCRVDLHDADGNPCRPGVVGEIVVGGEPGVTLFAGYLDDPGTTAASYRDSWFRTGDRAIRDENGRYRFDGRRADVIKVSGENVSVVEVEGVLSAHPDVLEACVVGARDPVRDEVPVAFVVALRPVADDEAAGMVADLERWCEGRLARAKRPRRYTFVDELPRTSVGKIRKYVLKEEATR